MTKCSQYIIILGILFLFPKFQTSAQPWKSPLLMAWSKNGIQFDEPIIFQDSAGVPSIVKWKGDTVMAVFQWFRMPDPSPTWDRVAVKFSYDNGKNWTTPVPVMFKGIPSGFQRPFDPTLAVINKDSLRIYFSSSNGISSGGSDSSINTYSALSTDGINYSFENYARVDVLTSKVIDPAVIYFHQLWHYISPIGAPEQGAYHFISDKGLKYFKAPDIPSDNMHNWTGNYMVESNNELRFYGCGPDIWYNYSENGGVWKGYVQTNVKGGDPSVVKIADSNYLMVFVGQPYPTGLSSWYKKSNKPAVYPNPAKDVLNIIFPDHIADFEVQILNSMGNYIRKSHSDQINLSDLPNGMYILKICYNGYEIYKRVIINR